MELMLEFQKVHEQDTAAAQEPSPMVSTPPLEMPIAPSVGARQWRDRAPWTSSSEVARSSSWTGETDTQVSTNKKQKRQNRRQKKPQDEKEETDERGKASLITESENMQESAENDESQTWKSRWGIEQPTTSEMRDNRWMVSRVVQARETQAQVRLAEEQAAVWVESRPSRSARDDFLRLPFSRSATGDDRQSFQRPPALELDGTPSEPPSERLFPWVSPEYRSRVAESTPRSARPGIVNRSLAFRGVLKGDFQPRDRCKPQRYRDLAGVVRNGASSTNKDPVMHNLAVAKQNTELPLAGVQSIELTKQAAQEAPKQQQKLGQEAQAAGSSSNPATQRATAASSDASDPAVASHDASELMAGAEKEAEDLAIKDQPQQPVRRKARDGVLYTKEDFLNFYKDKGMNMWDVAAQTEESGRGAA